MVIVVQFGNHDRKGKHAIPNNRTKPIKKLAKEPKIVSRRKALALKRQQPLFEARNYQKQKVKVARLYEKMTNARTDYLHKISTDIIKNHDVIGIEDLPVANMLKTLH